MSADIEGGTTTLSPDEAFAVLGNEYRIKILQTLGEADEVLSFSELRDQVGMADPGQFNYHLDKLVGHFLKNADEGYSLRQPGRRVIEAVLSGAVTEAPTMARTEIDQSCHFCGATTVEVNYLEEQVGLYCPECQGMYGGMREGSEGELPGEMNRLGYLPLTPAGVQNREPDETLRAAWISMLGEVITVVGGVCPRCSGKIENSLDICDNHEEAGEICDHCNRRYAIGFRSVCDNCIYERSGVMALLLQIHPDLRTFLLDHGIDLYTNELGEYFEIVFDYDEEIVSRDPVKAKLTFSVDEDSLTLTMAGDLTIEDSTRTRGPEQTE